jgi:outer membrane protein OmpA-like peptidoglycan-associated protein
VKPVASKAGWTVVSENPNGGFLALLRYNQNGIEAWLNAVVDDSSSPMRLVLDLVEIAPPPISLTLKEPAATPERLPAPGNSDFPFLAPLPGSVAHGREESAAPFRLTPKGATQPEIVANGSIELRYTLKDLSQVLFHAAYHEALTKAGWEIVEETANDEVIVAHYAKNGRNIWAYLDDHGDSYSIKVGKETSTDQMKASLAAACHVALYGVLFDFNKATLQAASDGPLQQVALLMAANPSTNLEIQGHTDDVGGDAYNQTLSEARARSVIAWLAQHGIAAARMTAKGYGNTMPIADNKTDEGRMKNRRVEIADPRCKPQKK